MKKKLLLVIVFLGLGFTGASANNMDVLDQQVETIKKKVVTDREEFKKDPTKLNYLKLDASTLILEAVIELRAKVVDKNIPDEKLIILVRDINRVIKTMR